MEEYDADVALMFIRRQCYLCCHFLCCLLRHTYMCLLLLFAVIYDHFRENSWRILLYCVF